MLLHELHNDLFAAFENRIQSWTWQQSPDATYTAGTTGYVPVLYPYTQPTDRKVLGEYNTNDSDKQVGYPFISIDPLQFYRDDTIVYNDETYVVDETSGTVVTRQGGVRFIFPYRVTGVSNNLLDHSILQMCVLEKVFPYVRGMRSFESGTTVLYMERDDAEETKDETTGVHQFSAIFKVYIHLVTAPEVVDPVINTVMLNIYSRDEADVAALTATVQAFDPVFCNSESVYCDSENVNCNF